MFISRTLLIAACVAFTACNSSKNTANTTMEDEKTMEQKKLERKQMLEQGFNEGTILYSAAEGDCEYTIKMATKVENVLYDPINLNESFKKEGMKVWFKFRGLRMMNRCEDANPIELSEIKAM